MSLPDLPSALARALETRGYSDLTPVQLAVVKPEAAGRDLLVSAKTGSGKTVAYGLALSGEILGEDEVLPPAADPLALIIAPTRELALQVQRELEWLYAPAGAKVVSCVGGMDPRREQRALAAGAHIVVGTPGRLRDHLERGQLKLSSLRAAVLDEADEMLDLGFREELEAILDAAPTERRILLFSATLPKPIVTLAREYQKDALRITVAGGEQGHSDIDYRAIRIAPSDTEHVVVNLLRYYEAGAALVFCSTREAVRRLHANLVERGFSVVALSGELTQNERTHALQALRDRRARVCVATDVAARGIDIPDLELVIHAELPHDAESLQHRSGRTGRAGRKGVSVILATHPRRKRAEALFRTAKLDVEWTPAPSAEDIRGRDQERLIEQLRPSGEAAEDDLTIARALLADAEPELVVASLIRASRAALPAPEDLVDNEPEPAFGPRSSAPRPGFEDTAWFVVDIGRNKNAEARWLLPMICRKGHITKSDIGAIRVFDRETRFEIVRSVEGRFIAALQKAEDDGVHIDPLAEPDMPPARDRKPYRKSAGGNDARPRSEYHAREQQSGGYGDARPAQRERPPQDRPAQDRPFAERPAAERPFKEKPFKDKPFREKPLKETPFREKPYGEGRAEGGRPAEGRPYEKKAYGAGAPRAPKGDGPRPVTSQRQVAKFRPKAAGGKPPVVGKPRKPKG
jgi:ATP-dependent RNA helicase DeaD